MVSLPGALRCLSATLLAVPVGTISDAAAMLVPDPASKPPDPRLIRHEPRSILLAAAFFRLDGRLRDGVATMFRQATPMMWLPGAMAGLAWPSLRLATSMFWLAAPMLADSASRARVVRAAVPLSGSMIQLEASSIRLFG
jgi:hypothetical protein